jgi:hypothetical protein
VTRRVRLLGAYRWTVRVLPPRDQYVGVNFTRAEVELLRERARRSGWTLARYVHETAVNAGEPLLAAPIQAATALGWLAELRQEHDDMVRHVERRETAPALSIAERIGQGIDQVRRLLLGFPAEGRHADDPAAD